MELLAEERAKQDIKWQMLLEPSVKMSRKNRIDAEKQSYSNAADKRAAGFLMDSLFDHEDYFNYIRPLLDEEGVLRPNLLEEKDAVLKTLMTWGQRRKRKLTAEQEAYRIAKRSRYHWLAEKYYRWLLCLSLRPYCNFSFLPLGKRSCSPTMTTTPLSARNPPQRRRPRSSTEQRPRLDTRFRTMRSLTRTRLVAGSELMERGRVGVTGRRRRMHLLTLSHQADILGRGQARGQHRGQAGTKSTLRLQQVSSLLGSLRPASSVERSGTCKDPARRSEFLVSAS